MEQLPFSGFTAVCISLVGLGEILLLLTRIADVYDPENQRRRKNILRKNEKLLGAFSQFISKFFSRYPFLVPETRLWKPKNKLYSYDNEEKNLREWCDHTFGKDGYQGVNVIEKYYPQIYIVTVLANIKTYTYDLKNLTVTSPMHEYRKKLQNELPFHDRVMLYVKFIDREKFSKGGLTYTIWV